MLIDLLCLGIDACLVGVFYKLYKGKKLAVELLQNAPHYEINQKLTSELGDDDRTLPYAILKGTVKAMYMPIQSENVPQITGVIRKFVSKEEQVKWNWMGRWWTESEKELQRTENVVQFVLSGLDGRGEVEVLEPLKSSFMKLTTVHESFTPHRPGVGEMLMGFMWGEHSKGIRNKEKMLTEGTLLTGAGQLVIKYGRLRLGPPKNGEPYFLTPLSEAELIQNLQSQSRAFKILASVLAAFGLYIAALVSYKLYQKYKERLEHENNLKKLEEIRRERMRNNRDTNSNNSNPDNQCVICLTNLREVVILECGHICCCLDCAEAIQPPKCPICRSDITRLLPAYMS